MEKTTAWAFNVPNTICGKAFIRLLRLYLNPNRQIRLRGRGPRTKGRGYTRDLRLCDSERIAVYIERKK